MTPGNQFRQNYCDLYPATRRKTKAVWPRAVAAFSALSCLCLTGLLLASRYS